VICIKSVEESLRRVLDLRGLRLVDKKIRLSLLKFDDVTTSMCNLFRDVCEECGFVGYVALSV
jgi:hypothetical protein